MRPDYETNASATGTTHASAHDRRSSSASDDPQSRGETNPPPPADAPAKSLSEAEFLQQQAANAKAAIGRAMADFTGRLGHGVDPRLWAKEYPWYTVGAAAVGGFVATALLVPSREQRALRKLAAIERALNPPAPRAKKVEHLDGEESEGDAKRGFKAGRHGFLTSIAGEVIAAVKPAVISLLTAGVTAKTAKTSPEEMKAAAAAEDQDNAAASGAYDTPPA